MMFLVSFLLSIYIVLSQTSIEKLADQKEDTTLLLVQALIRHGESSPKFIYKNDPNANFKWPEGISKLTLLGKQHHYDLGKFLRSKYKDFLTFNKKEMLVNSSALDRCLKGAEITAASLYEIEWLWRFEDYFDVKPISVCYLRTVHDRFLSGDSDCPRGFEELRRLRNSEEFHMLNRKHQKMLEEVSNFVEIDISETFKALLLGETLRIEKSYNLTFPTLIDNYFEEIVEFGDATFKCFFGSDLMMRLRVGPLLQAISENMQKKINGDIPDLKFQLYSIQDITVAAILNALNFTNMPRPPNCATVLFELHEMTDGTIAVRLLYMNSSNPLINKEELHTLILDGCSEFCPLENFTNKFQHLIPDDWEQECQLYRSNIRKSVVMLAMIFSTAINFSIFLLICIYFLKKKSNEKQKIIFLRKIPDNIVKNVLK